MNPRILVTASLLPMAALAAVVAPVLLPAADPPQTPGATSTHDLPPPAAVPPPVVPTVAAPVEGHGLHLTVTPDRSVLWTEGDRRMRVRVDWWADEGAETRSTPTDLVVVLDRSGSMDGEKILDARAATAELVSQLGPEDRFALVSFASDTTVDVPLTGVGNRAAWGEAIERLWVGGGTGMVEGLSVGLAQVAPVPGRARRVVLVSDGRPDDAVPLDAIAAGAARSETPLTTIGIGVDYDEALMQRIADRGTGNFYWAQRGPELQGVLAAELSSARKTVATGIRLGLAGGATIVDAGGLPVDDGRVDLGMLRAGQHRSLWVTVAVPGGGHSAPIGTFALGFTPSEGTPASLVAAAPSVSLVSDARVAFAALGDEWASSVVNDDYNRLRTEVSASVQRGDQQAAIAAMNEYRLANEQLNAVAQNPMVTDNLKELDALQVDVNQQFQGEDQRARQNVWSKGTRVDAYSKRRVGQVAPMPMPASR